MFSIQDQTCPAKLSSVAFDGPGVQVGSCLNDDHAYRYKIVSGKLENVGGFISDVKLETNPYMRPGVGRVGFGETKVRFLDKDTLLVAREVNRWSDTPDVRRDDFSRFVVSKIDIEEGNILGEFEDPGPGPISGPLVVVPGQAVLLSLGASLVFVDPVSMKEVLRIPGSQSGGTSNDQTEGLGGDVQVSPNGVSYHPQSGRLYLLVAEYLRTIMHTYKVDLSGRKFGRVATEEVDQGSESWGSCMSPDGSELAAWCVNMGEVLDFRKEKLTRLPERFRLGHFVIVSAKGHRVVNVESVIRRDFHYQVEKARGPGGVAFDVGYTIAGKTELASPFYLDERSIVLNTPSGILLRIDTHTGQSETLHDFEEPIKDMCFHREKQLLVVGTARGRVVLCSV